MNTRRYAPATWIISALLCGAAVNCSSDDSSSNGTSSSSTGGSQGNSTGSTGSQGSTSSGSTGGGQTNTTGGGGGSDGGSDGAAPNYTYTLIDDMESTNNGPILLAGITDPFTPGYWYNFGAGVKPDAGGDTATPVIGAFAFSDITPPTMPHAHASMKGAHQVCTLTGQYDVCGIGMEFVQITDPEAGIPEAGGPTPGGDAAAAGDAASASDARADATSTTTDASATGGDSSTVRTGDAGDSGPPIPKITVPFDISQYKGITFWGKAVAAADASGLDVKVQFPDTDTDPRGGVCNSDVAGAGGPSDTTQCYNSFASHVIMTGEWQQFTVLFSDLKIDPNFGFQTPAPFEGAEAGAVDGAKKVYGINWQTQKNTMASAGPESFDFWVDDVYFIQ